MTHPPHRPSSVPDDELRIRRLLSTLPEPEPMPADLVRRITERLDEESRSAGTVVPFPPPSPSRTPSRRFVLSLAGAAAAAAVVGTVGLHLVRNDAAPTVAAAFGGDSRVARVHTQVSSTRYVPATLARDAARLDATAATPSQLRPLAAEAPTTGPLGTPTGARACLDSLGVDPSGAVLDLALYEGKPAAVVVSGRPGAREARVVPRSCGNGSTAVLHGPVALH